ncbi:DEAD/DEAH box helicase family protein [Leuconostoc mesenteroides]|uniref:DEAD/DEAH box helicase family protein n=1 Tax=Leuconostoc mesenteroides TaxID=1245 RepID=UPI00123A3D76|nr:DEAD/DEAH box helicase family protein [Leuconostoc mesenteroides]KAA8369268.1 DEAD/DEAH box helicase [Leuconostoc mesenteroides]
MSFKFNKKDTFNYDSPQNMYADYKQKKIKGLWDYQTTIIDKFILAYEKNDSQNIALELPTGSGKTLVGLVIAEYIRRKEKKKVVFVCLNNQLVKQVADEAKELYQIPVVSFTGKRSEYSSIDQLAYNNGQKIAITNYSSIFNTASYFQEADIFIFDDAHNASTYIMNCWSISINKFEQENLFGQLVDVLKRVISDNSYNHLTNTNENTSDPQWVDMIPSMSIDKVSNEIRSLFDSLPLENHESIIYAWKLIRDHLDACNLYISENTILICPPIAPCETISSFSNANTRIFMSATLGNSGELERTFGIENVKKISLPTEKKPRIGRRLFLYPDIFFPKKNKNESLFVTLKTDFPRTIGLVNSSKDEAALTEVMSEHSPTTTVYSGSSLKDNMDSFKVNTDATAILANRYDGVSFSDDCSHLLLIKNLPHYQNLQDSFFSSRLKADPLLFERLITRITQAVGRCTRSTNDFAAIIIEGNDLQDILTSSEKQSLFNPELRAEISTGIDISEQLEDLQSMADTAKLVLNQNSIDWQEIENEIIQRRDNFESEPSRWESDLNTVLKKIATKEVKFEYNMWFGDYQSAVHISNSIFKCISESGVSSLDGLKSYWKYMSLSVKLRYLHDSEALDYQSTLSELKSFISGTNNLSWFKSLSSSFVSATDYNKEQLNNNRILGMVENIELVFHNNLSGLTTAKRKEKFEKIKQDILTTLSSGRGTQYEKSVQQLGYWLGFLSENSNSSGAPDPWWFVDNRLVIVSEIKILNDDQCISKKHVDESNGHIDWLKNSPETPNIDNSTEFISVLISNKNSITTDAQLVVSKDTFYINAKDLLRFAENSLNTVQRIYDNYDGSGNIIWNGQAKQIISTSLFNPGNLIQQLTTKVKDLPTA